MVHHAHDGIAAGRIVTGKLAAEISEVLGFGWIKMALPQGDQNLSNSRQSGGAPRFFAIR